MYNALGTMKTHQRGIGYRTRLSKLNAAGTDRIVLWDSTSNNIMSHHDSISSVRVYLQVEPTPGGTTEPKMHTMDTFPISAGDTLDATMHDALKDGIQTWCNSHFEKLQVQPSMAMPPDSHVLKLEVKRVYDSTRTWAYDDSHEHVGCFRKDPTRADGGSEQEGENDIDRVCAIIHLVAPCTHTILNQIECFFGELALQQQ